MSGGRWGRFVRKEAKKGEGIWGGERRRMEQKSLDTMKQEAGRDTNGGKNQYSVPSGANMWN